MVAPNAIVTRSVTKSPPRVVNAADASSSAKIETTNVLAKSPLSAKTSPCAKLMSWRIP
jgi:hypothetical protein